MEVRAIVKNVRISEQKVRLVVDQIRKRSPVDALKVLPFIPQKSSLVMRKVIQSALANAKNNFGLSEESLAFKQIIVSKGPMFKRFRAVARGRAHQILRRTSHISVILEGQEKKQVVKTDLKKVEGKSE